jgi:D-3-phosphoglycerate dehydrogenase
MINQGNLAKMKKGAILINTSRGDLVNTEAVVDALKSGQLSAIGFDVTNPEPLPADAPIRSFPQAVINAHLASVSPQAQRRLRSTAAETALAAIQGKPLKNVLNGV